MSHASNLAEIKKLLNESYDREITRKVPKRTDLTFGNKLTRMDHAVVLYVDMRSSRKILSDTTPFVSVKAHRAFLRALVNCIENRDGHFRSFNGDGALAFFIGDNGASRAVCAAMEFKAYVLEINKILKSKGTKFDFGAGIGQGKVDVAKSGKAGDDAMKQDLIWIGLPVYVAVELSDLGEHPNNIWISPHVRNSINKEKHLNVVHSNGKNMWTMATKNLKSVGSYEVRFTNYHKMLF